MKSTLSRRTVLSGMGAVTLAGLASATVFKANAKNINVKTKLPFTGYIRTNWSQDPFSYGAYSHVAKDSGVDDIKILAKPVEDKVYFAGEAVNPDYQSTVHAALESGETAANALLKNNKKKVAVIGAGAAGLAAARVIHNAGVEVKVLEGRNRIGGRVWTDRSIGPPLEQGAAFIVGENGNPVSKLADSVNAKRVGFGIDDSEGDVVLNKKGEKMWSLFHPSWLEELVLNNSMGTDYQNLNMDHVEANIENYFGHYKGDNVVFPGGYDQILVPLQTGYDIQLNTIVNRITRTTDGVAVGFKTGETQAESSQSFDAVIVTVPLGVLKKGVIAFEPGLPDEKMQAIARMGMGTVDKLFMMFDRKFWHDAPWIFTPENGLPQGQFNMWMDHSAVGANVLGAFNPGSPALALATESDEVVVAKALGVLEKLYGNKV